MLVEGVGSPDASASTGGSFVKALLYSIVAASTLVLMSGPALAGTKYYYRWVDTEGQVHYGDQPPDGYPYERMNRNPTNAPANSSPAPTPQESETDTPLSNDGDASTGTTEAALRNCEQARAELKILEENARIREVQPDGSSRILSPEEKQARVDRARSMAAANCDAN